LLKVRFSLDHFVGVRKQSRRNVEPERLGGLEILMTNLVGCRTGSSPGFSPRRIRLTYEAARRY
jgi:hypothetical protein